MLIYDMYHISFLCYAILYVLHIVILFSVIMFVCNMYYIGMSSRRRTGGHSGSPSSSQRGHARPDGGDGGGPSQELRRPVVWLKPKADQR